MAASWFGVVTNVNIALFDATVVKRLVVTGPNCCRQTITVISQTAYSLLKAQTQDPPLTSCHCRQAHRSIVIAQAWERITRSPADLKNDTAYERKKIRCEAESETQMRAHACGTLTNAHALQEFRTGSKCRSFESTVSPMAACHRAVASFHPLLKY